MEQVITNTGGDTPPSECSTILATLQNSTKAAWKSTSMVHNDTVYYYQDDL